MAIISVNPLFAENSRSSLDGFREYVAYYQVQTDSVLDSCIVVRDAPGIPIINSPFVFGNDFDYGAFAKEYSVQLKSNPDDHKRLWIVTVRYDTEPIRRGEDQYLDDPIAEPPVIGGSFVTDRIAVTSDRNGDPVANSAGGQFEDLERDRSNLTLTIQKNFDEWDLTTHVEYIDTVNSSTFFTLSARKWRLTNIRTQQLFRGDATTPYFQVMFEFVSNQDTWDFKPADRGWYYLSTGNEKLVFRDAKGFQMNAPGLLNGSGGQLASTANVVYFDGAGGNPSAFRVYPEKDFANLNIPTSDPSIV